MDNKIQREKDFHNEAFAKGTRRELDKYYSIFGPIRQDFLNLLQPQAQGRKVLEYGCGVSDALSKISPLAVELVGIDISEEAVLQSRKKALDDGLENCRFAVMNAEQLEFEPESFDVVFGYGIIHHLDLNKAYSEIARVLRPGGKAFFMEPLGHNPIINLYRRFTPSMRTPDEHPLLRKDLKCSQLFFKQVHISYYHLFTLFAVPFRRHAIFGSLFKGLSALDKMVFQYIPGAKYLAWYTIIELSMPDILEKDLHP